VVSTAVDDFLSVPLLMLRNEPSEAYNPAGQNSVDLSFEYPVPTLESISIGTLNLLEVIR
jgi:GDPmannose 4,6-dehydratase